MSDVITFGNYVIAKDRRYTEKHMWVKVLEGSRARVGISDYAQKKLKSIVYVEPPEVPKEVKAGDLITTIESIKAVGELVAPVAGRVVAWNERLDESPELINEDPYGEGWVVEMEVEDPSQVESLLTPEQYLEVIKKEG